MDRRESDNLFRSNLGPDVYNNFCAELARYLSRYIHPGKQPQPPPGVTGAARRLMMRDFTHVEFGP
jgi:hypothetical protein